MPNKITKVKKLKVGAFRGLNDIEISFGNKLTIICGKNGTSKSTILGLIAQIFSFSKDLSTNPPTNLKQFKTLTDSQFKSAYSEHFRISRAFDMPGSLSVGYEVYDGTVDKLLDKLTLGLYFSRDRAKARAVVRGNDGIPDINTSRNLTHPVIFLSLKRLLPITLRDNYTSRDVEYLVDNSAAITAMNNRLLIKSSTSVITATTGTIDSLVVHGENYDHESVSVGEDNIGQIIQSIFSFKRLKENYGDFHGGILLIDEADAGLFPAAQVNLIKVLMKAAKDYDLQIIMTSHSPIMIEEVYNLHKLATVDFKTVYLTDSYGSIQVKEDYSWPEINADLYVKTIAIDASLSLPKVNVYFEDYEGYSFVRQLISSRKINKLLSPLKDINLSCSTICDLMSRKVPEFTSKSIVVLDGDLKNDSSPNAKKALKERNISLLPTILPPDQLIFEFLYNLAEDHPYWRFNSIGFNRRTLLNISGDIIRVLQLDAPPIDLKASINQYAAVHRGNGTKGVIRKLFKDFAHHSDFEALIKGPVKANPYRYWVKENKELALEFQQDFIKALVHVLTVGFGMSSGDVLGYINEDATT